MFPIQDLIIFFFKKKLIDKSNGFTVEYFDTYKVLTNIITDERYALVCCNNSLANFTTGYHGAVNTPLNNVAVENELDALTFFEVKYNPTLCFHII